MTKWLLSAALILSAFPSTTIAQTKESLVGTWKLVSATNTNEKGEVEDRYGASPIGFLTYTADGRVSVFMADSERKPVSNYPPSAAEATDALNTFFAYAGSYSLAGDKVTHYIDICSIQNLGKTNQVRSVKLEGDRLTLLGRSPRGGVMVTLELVWERVKPSKP